LFDAIALCQICGKAHSIAEELVKRPVELIDVRWV